MPSNRVFPLDVLKQHSSPYGFTLLELSIVLVIMGLLAGGVIVGSHLVRAAEIRSVFKDLKNYETAVNTFTLQYNELPGDMKNASSFFTGLPDGNGDNDIYFADESFWAWKHLAAAGMVGGSYDNQTAYGAAQPGKSVPASKMSPGCYELEADSAVYEGNRVYIHWGHTIPGNDNISLCRGGLLTPAELQAWDAKSDDGLPLDGDIQVNDDYNPDCVTGSNPKAYNLANQGRVCNINYFIR